MIPQYYEFFCPVKILSGQKALSNLAYEMKLLGASRAMVVTDKGVVGAGLMKLIDEAMAGQEAVIATVYDKTPPDSSDKVCNEVAEIYRKEKCDCLLAVGGGSAIDTAKGANIVISEETDDLMKFQGMDRLTKETVPLIVVPTTAGTGSEVTLVAVIRNSEKDTKMPFVSDRLYPRLAILDPAMTQTMPPKITAATGMDALTHAIEAVYSLQRNPISDTLAFGAIDLIFKNLHTCVVKPNDLDARLAMANAALIAGAAFSNAMVGVVHAVAHAAGGVCHVPHGVANSILLPFGMEYNLEKVPERLAVLCPYMGISNIPTDPKQAAEAAVKAVRELAKKLNADSGLPLSLKEAGVTEDKLEAIAKTAINDGSCTYNPEDVAYEDALAIVKKAY